MITLDPSSQSPVFVQIVDQVVAAIIAQQILPGARLPTVRALARDLGVSANTVAKAYRQLESEGHVGTGGRNGTVVLERRSAGHADGGQPQDDSLVAARALVRAAQRRGLDLTETIGLLRQCW